MKKQHSILLTASLAAVLLIGSLAAAGCGGLCCFVRKENTHAV